MPNAKVLITGISEYIAGHVAKQLLENGYHVVGTVRKLSKKDTIIEAFERQNSPISKLEFVEIDLLDSLDKWVEITKGITHIFHLASPFPITQPKNDEEIVKPATQGILNVLESAKVNEAKKVILTSSIVACAYGKRKNGVFTEEDWTDETNLEDTSAYVRSKTIAEKTAYKWIKENNPGFDFASILPSLVLGPSVYPDFGTSVEVIDLILKGSMPALPKIGFNVVDVRSVVDLHLRVMFSEATGRYIGSGKWMSLKEVATILKNAFPDRKVTTREIPDFLVRFLALLDPSIRTILIDLNAKKELDTSKAKSLGWENIDEEKTIIETAQKLI